MNLSEFDALNNFLFEAGTLGRDPVSIPAQWFRLG